ncbi:MAG: PQQ-binding-like beta-propeller repeat protein [Acidobacteria bacterium]|nr:PQQ-binding-like beta-propeller repeat protein [Acidobacteriota bacterium]
MPTRQHIAFTVIWACCLLPAFASAQPSVPPPPPPPPLVWHMPGTAVGIPTHDADTVYVLDKNREVLALHSTDGRLKWRTGTGVTSADEIFGLTTSGTNLVITGDLVVAGDWDIVAFERRSGARRWSFQADGGDGPGLFLGAASGDTVYAGSVTGRVYAIDAGTGRARWVARLEEKPMVSVFAPEREGTQVLVGYSVYDNPSTGGIASLDASTGRVTWKTQFPKSDDPGRHTNRSGGPVVVGGLVFGSAGDGNIYGLDLATGAIRSTLPRLAGPFAGYITATDLDHRTLVRAGQLLVAGSVTGKITAYDVEARTVKWEHDAGPWGSTSFSFSADDAHVYIPFLGGFVMALDAATGEERWRVGDFNVGMIWAPDPNGEHVYAAGSRGGVYAFARRAPAPGDWRQQ